MINIQAFLKAFALFGGQFVDSDDTKSAETFPSEVAHLSKKERKKRKRTQYLSTRKRRRKS